MKDQNFISCFTIFLCTILSVILLVVLVLGGRLGVYSDIIGSIYYDPTTRFFLLPEQQQQQQQRPNNNNNRNNNSNNPNPNKNVIISKEQYQDFQQHRNDDNNNNNINNIDNNDNTLPFSSQPQQSQSQQQQQQQQSQSQQHPPNILFLFPDQWRYDWDGRDPNIPLDIPTIRQLIREGTHFLHAYVPSPVCAPARACLASGREYDHANVPTNQHNDYDLTIPTFYTALRDVYNYQTYTVGKDDLTKATKFGNIIARGKSNNNNNNKGIFNNINNHDNNGNNNHNNDHDMYNWTGLYHQYELGFSDGSLRCGGKVDVVSLDEPHEPYGHWLQQQSITLKNGTIINGWDAHVICMNHTNKCTPELFPGAFYEDDWVTRRTIQILDDHYDHYYELQQKQQERQERQQSSTTTTTQSSSFSSPWFLQVNFPGPHPPFFVTPKQYKAVWNRTFPPPADNPHFQDPEVCSERRNNNNNNNNNGNNNNNKNSIYYDRNDRCNYAAEMENIDQNIQRILEHVADKTKNDSNNNNNNDNNDNTIICFASDHGEMLQDHQWNGKTVPWQASVSVPLICKGPGIQAGAVIERPVSIMDLAATFLDYAATAAAGATAADDSSNNNNNNVGSTGIGSSSNSRTITTATDITSSNGEDNNNKNQNLLFESSSSSSSSSLLLSSFFDSMTSQSLRKLLETGEDDTYRTFVSSGLQSMPFEENHMFVDDATTVSSSSSSSTTTTTQREASSKSSNWRMVVEASTGLKFICCHGVCPGGRPSTIPPIVNENGYQEILLDTIHDPYDMNPLNEIFPEAIERLRSLLPPSFGCNIKK